MTGDPGSRATPLSPAAVMAAALAGWSPAGRARWLQAARDGRWEDARGLDVPGDAAAARALVHAAGPADADVAVEFEWLGHPLVFAGARRARTGSAGGAAFADRVAGLVVDEPEGPVQALARLAGGTPRRPAHIELGAANAWQSVRPLTLWRAREGRPRTSVADMLGARPELAVCAAPVAVAVAYAQPCSCWFGVEVSERSTEGHRVVPAVVEALVQQLLPAT